MTQPEARHVLHSAAAIREAVETIARERTEAVLLAWSEQVYNVLKVEGLGPADIAARGGPAERTLTLMLKAGNTRLSTMVELATALCSSEADYQLEVRLVRKPKP